MFIERERSYMGQGFLMRGRSRSEANTEGTCTPEMMMEDSKLKKGLGRRRRDNVGRMIGPWVMLSR